MYEVSITILLCHEHRKCALDKILTKCLDNFPKDLFHAASERLAPWEGGQQLLWKFKERKKHVNGLICTQHSLAHLRFNHSQRFTGENTKATQGRKLCEEHWSLVCVNPTSHILSLNHFFWFPLGNQIRAYKIYTKSNDLIRIRSRLLSIWELQCVRTNEHHTAQN